MDTKTDKMMNVDEMIYELENTFAADFIETGALLKTLKHLKDIDPSYDPNDEVSMIDEEIKRKVYRFGGVAHQIRIWVEQMGLNCRLVLSRRAFEAFAHDCKFKDMKCEGTKNQLWGYDFRVDDDTDEYVSLEVVDHRKEVMK